MSGEQDAPDQDEIERAMREAEQAIDAVRGGADPADESGGEVIEMVDADDGGDDGALEAAQAEVAALKDRWLRAVADHENYKKRVKRDIDDAVHRAVQNLLGSFLPVGDNLDRALSVVPEGTDEQLLRGIDMVKQEFFSALKKHGITAVESVGRPFDPSVHDALQQIDSPDYPPGTVAMEYEKGYMRGEKLLRPARVIVAGPGSTGTAPEPEGDDAN